MKAGKEHIEDIVSWFETVCDGIRAEYEADGDKRSLEQDKQTLEAELLRFVE